MSFEIISAYDKQDEVRVLFKEYTDYLVENDKKFAEYLAIQNYDDELKDFSVKYGKPYGSLYIAKEDGALAGCIAMKKHESEENTGELKRLYVRPEFRGKGYSRLLSEKIVEDAIAAGYDALYLDTLPFLVAAQHLYGSMGFEVCAPYNDDPMGCSIFMRKELKND